MQTGKSIDELRGPKRGRDVLYAAQQVPYAGPVLGLLHGWGQNARTQAMADDMKTKEAHITFAEKLAGCNKPKMAPSYSKKAKIGKKPMPQPHERQRKKVATFGIVGGGSVAGGTLESLLAPAGHKAEGYGRGANRGLNTALGAGLGSIPGAALGAWLSKRTGDPNMARNMIYGGGAGAALGGLLGNAMTDNGIPSWENDGKITQDQRDSQIGAGTIGAGLLGAGLGTFGARAAGGDRISQLLAGLGVGAPAALLTGHLLEKNIPQSADNTMSPETENEMTAEQMAAP